jgi:hypothetical protein
MRKKKYTSYVGVLFDDDTHNKIVQITDKAEISLSEFVRTIVEDKLKQMQEEGT